MRMKSVKLSKQKTLTSTMLYKIYKILEMYWRSSISMNLMIKIIRFRMLKIINKKRRKKKRKRIKRKKIKMNKELKLVKLFK